MCFWVSQNKLAAQIFKKQICFTINQDKSYKKKKILLGLNFNFSGKLNYDSITKPFFYREYLIFHYYAFCDIKSYAFLWFEG